MESQPSARASIKTILAEVAGGEVPKKTAERTFAAPYEPVVKAFLLALQAQKLRLSVAFDAAHGACVEAELQNDMLFRGAGRFRFRLRTPVLARRSPELRN